MSLRSEIEALRDEWRRNDREAMAAGIGRHGNFGPTVADRLDAILARTSEPLRVSGDCADCGALIPADCVGRHAAWHRSLAAPIMSEIDVAMAMYTATGHVRWEQSNYAHEFWIKAARAAMKILRTAPTVPTRDGGLADDARKSRRAGSPDGLASCRDDRSAIGSETPGTNGAGPTQERRKEIRYRFMETSGGRMSIDGQLPGGLMDRRREG